MVSCLCDTDVKSLYGELLVYYRYKGSALRALCEIQMYKVCMVSFLCDRNLKILHVELFV